MNKQTDQWNRLSSTKINLSIWKFNMWEISGGSLYYSINGIGTNHKIVAKCKEMNLYLYLMLNIRINSKCIKI